MRFKALPLIRHFTTTPNIKPKICVVGSGPAGFYAAQYMATRLETAEIDIFERLPVPFGLVRFGVAPDHANLKNCINTFTKTAQFKNVRFMGNINVGKDVSIKQLREAYHVILLVFKYCIIYT
jgi:adrenodoxin-NADP+ reductase